MIRLRDSTIESIVSKLQKIEIELSKYNQPKMAKWFDVQVPNSDMTLIQLEIKNSINEVLKTLQPMSFHNKAGYKIDFSTGFFHTQLKDQSIKVISKQTTINNIIQDVDSVKRVVKEDDGKGKISFGILAHYYTRWFKYFNVGISSGFNYQLEDKIINFMVGGSVLLGSQQRFVISYGWSIGNIKTLNEELYKLNTDYSKTVLTNNTDVYVNKLTAKPFIGLSYNLGTLSTTKRSTYNL